MDQQNKDLLINMLYAPAGATIKELSVKFQFQNRDI
jgi:hypothetical protein